MIIAASKNIARVNVTLEVRNDPAYGIKLFVKHPEMLSFHSVTGEGLVPQCRRKLYTKGNVTCSLDEVNAEEKVGLSRSHYSVEELANNVQVADSFTD